MTPRLWSAFRGGGGGEVKDAITRRFSSGPNFAFQGVPYTPPDGADVEKVVKEQWSRVIWVMRAIDARAANASNLTIHIRDGIDPENSRVIENHPLFALFNEEAHEHETAWNFRYRFHTLADLSKKGVFVEVLEDRMGVPRRLVMLNPQHIWPVPNPDTFVERFEMRLPNGEVFGELPPYKQGKGGVLWFKRPHPTDPYSSWTWLEAAGISIDLDYYARLYNRNFMFNDGRPGGVLVVGKAQEGDDEDEIDPADAQALASRLQAGPANAGKIAVWEGDLDYIDLSTSPRDAQYVESRALTQREILVAAGTPLSVIGDASGRTFDNADAEEETFWRHTMPAELRLFASGFRKMLDPGEYAVHDLSQVAVLQRDKRARKKTLDDDYAQGRITLDEWRTETGRDTMDVPGSQVVWQSAGKAPIGPEEYVNALLTQGQEPAPENAGTGELLPEDAAPELPMLEGEDPLQIEGPPLEDPVADQEIEALLQGKGYGSDQVKVRPTPKGYLDERRAAHDRLLTLWEGRVADAITSVMVRQEKLVLSRLHSAKARRHTRHWSGDVAGHEVKALNPTYILDRARWIGELVTAIRDVIGQAVAAAGGATYLHLTGADEQPSMGDLGDAVIARTVQLIGEHMDSRWGKIQTVIATAEAQGLPLSDIAEKVRDAYADADTWADTSSRNVVGAMNAASLIGATQAGAARKRWLATDDERTRTTHREAEGQVVAVHEPFQVGEALMMAPADPSGGLATIGEWINCRCTMLFQLAERDFDAELDQDLAELDSMEWKARGFRAAAAGVRGGFRGTFRVAWDPSAHARDDEGRFIDMPDVTLPDGRRARAVSARDGVTVVQREDGGMEKVSTDLLGDAQATEDVVADAPALAATAEPRPGRRGTGDGERAREEIPTVEELVTGGMTPDEAKKEWQRLYHNARFRIRRERIKKERDDQAAAATATAEDVAADPAPPPPAGAFKPTAPKPILQAVAAAKRAIGDPKTLGKKKRVPDTLEEYVQGDAYYQTLVKRRDEQLAEAADLEKAVAQGYRDDHVASFIADGYAPEDAVSAARWRDPETAEWVKEDIVRARGYAASTQAKLDEFQESMRDYYANAVMRDGDTWDADRDPKDEGPTAATDKALAKVTAVGQMIEEEAQRRAEAVSGVEELERQYDALREETAVAMDDRYAVEQAVKDEMWRESHHGYGFEEWNERSRTSDNEERMAGTITAQEYMERSAARHAEFERQNPLLGTDAARRLGQARQRVIDARAPQIAAAERLAKARTSRRKVLAEKRREVLAEVRPMGRARDEIRLQDFTPQAHDVSKPVAASEADKHDLREAVKDAHQVYPSDWLTRRDERGELKVAITTRGWAQERTAELTGSKGAPAWDGQGVFGSVAVHELGHHMEGTPGVKTLEWAWHWKRTATGRRGNRKRKGDNEILPLALIYPGGGYEAHEKGSKDEFATAYVGKVYTDDPDSSWEIFTMAAESLFAGSRYVDDDPDLGAFALGMMATL